MTGGCGLIGSAFVRLALAQDYNVVLLDRLKYAGHTGNISDVQGSNKLYFVKGDIRDQALFRSLLANYPIEGVVHFAAESHVYRSITAPYDF